MGEKGRGREGGREAKNEKKLMIKGEEGKKESEKRRKRDLRPIRKICIGITSPMEWLFVRPAIPIIKCLVVRAWTDLSGTANGAIADTEVGVVAWRAAVFHGDVVWLF